MAVLGRSRSGAPPDQILDPPLTCVLSKQAASMDYSHHTRNDSPEYELIRDNTLEKCKAQPRRALLGYPFRNTAAHTEATPTREGI